MCAVVSLLASVSGPSPALAAAQQQRASADLPVSLERIRAAVEKPNVRSLKLDVPSPLPMARFKTSVEQRRFMLSFEERLEKEFELTHLQRQSADWGSRCCGLDLGAILKPIDRALQQRKQRQVRQQIARELDALKAAADR